MDAISRANAARASWPEVAWPAESFVVRLEEAAALNDSDLYLADACAHLADGALAAFERNFLSKVPEFLQRMSPSASFVDEVAQLLRHKLFLGAPPKIAEYAGRGPLGGWLRVVTLRTAIDLSRTRGERVEPSIDPERFAQPFVDSPELEYLKSRYLPEVKRAFSEALQTLGSEERNVLRLHFVDGLSLEETARLFQVNRSTVFRWISDTRERLLDEARRRLRERLGVSAEEFDSLAQLVRSRLDFSINEVLR